MRFTYCALRANKEKILNADLLGPIFAFSLFAVFFAFMLSRIFKYGGLVAALYGARIKSTVGEVSVSGHNVSNIKVKIHALESVNDNKVVGLELVAKGAGLFRAGYQMNLFSLSAPAAAKLATLIHSTVQK